MDSKTVHEWRTQLNNEKPEAHSRPFEMKNLLDITCTISVILSNNETMTITVRKGYLRPGRANISINIPLSTTKTQCMTDWKEECVFLDFPMPLKLRMPSFQFSNQTTVPPSNITCLRNYDITINCEIEWLGFADEPLAQFKGLYDGLQSFCAKSQFSDFKIIIDGVDMPVHKVILAAQSEVFLAMFHPDTKESQVGAVDIVDIELDTMKEVIKYLYTGRTSAESDTEIAKTVLAAADKYQICKLKALCEATLLKNLSVENAVDILIIADRFSLKDLKDKTLIFATKNKLKIIGVEGAKELLMKQAPLMWELMCWGFRTV